MRNNGGFSLLEAILTTVGITVVGSIVIYALTAGITTYAASRDREDAVAPLRIAASRLARDLREIKSPSAMLAAAPDRLAYLDAGGREVGYQYAGGVLRRNGQPLLSDITSFRFVYRDRSGVPIAVPAVSPDPTDIRAVAIEIAADPGELKEEVEVAVCPRMLRE